MRFLAALRCRCEPLENSRSGSLQACGYDAPFRPCMLITVRRGLAHLLAQRLWVDPQISRDIRDRTLVLQRQTNAALKSTPWGTSTVVPSPKDSPFPRGRIHETEPPSNPAWLTRPLTGFAGRGWVQGRPDRPSGALFWADWTHLARWMFSKCSHASRCGCWHRRSASVERGRQAWPRSGGCQQRGDVCLV
jgi:hypothetical protein